MQQLIGIHTYVRNYANITLTYVRNIYIISNVNMAILVLTCQVYTEGSVCAKQGYHIKKLKHEEVHGKQRRPIVPITISRFDRSALKYVMHSTSYLLTNHHSLARLLLDSF